MAGVLCPRGIGSIVLPKNIWLAGIFHCTVNLPAAFSKFNYVETADIQTELPTAF